LSKVSVEKENRNGGFRGLGKGEDGEFSLGVEFQFYKMKRYG
jgi:hypothetical protein